MWPKTNLLEMFSSLFPVERQCQKFSYYMKYLLSISDAQIVSLHVSGYKVWFGKIEMV